MSMQIELAMTSGYLISPLKKTKSTHSPFHIFTSDPLSPLLLKFISFLPLEFIHDTLWRVSEKWSEWLQDCILDGSLFRERERRAYEPVLYTGSSIDTTKVHSLQHGFPQLLHDLYYFRIHGYHQPLTSRVREKFKSLYRSPDYRVLVTFRSYHEEDMFTSKHTMTEHPLCLSDKLIVLQVLHQNPEMLKHISPTLVGNMAFALDVVRTCKHVKFDIFPQQWWESRQIVLEMVQNNRIEFNDIPNSYLRDREIAIESAVVLSSVIIAHLSTQFTLDRAFVLECVQRKGNLLKEFAAHFHDDRDLAVIAIQSSNGAAFSSLSERLRNDRDLALTAVQQKGIMLRYIGDSLRNDDEIPTVAVQQNWKVLLYCEEKYRDDEKMILHGFEHNVAAIQYASPRLQEDREFCINLVRCKPHVFEFLSDTFRDDKDIVTLACRLDGGLMQFASERMKSNREVALESLTSSALSLPSIASQYYGDLQIMMLAAKHDGMMAMIYAKQELRSNRDLCLQSVKSNPRSFRLMRKQHRADKEIALIATESVPDNFEFVEGDLRADREFVKRAALRDVDVLMHAHESILHDTDFFMELVAEVGEYVWDYFLGDVPEGVDD